MKKIIFLTLAAIILCLSVNAATLGYWRFEEGVNNTIVPADKVWETYNVKWFQDASGNGNDMCTWAQWTSPRYTNELPFATVPQTGAANTLACWFGGGDGFLNDDIWSEGDIALNTGTTYSDGWTVETSVKFLSVSDWQVVVGKDGAPDGGAPIFSIKLNAADKKIEMNCWDGSGINHWLGTSNNSILIDTWYDIAGVCDGSTVKLYLKGPTDSQYVEMDSDTVSGGPLIADYSNWTIGRGQWNGGNTDYCNAIIDEVRISDEALPKSQLLAVVPEPGMIIGGIALALLVFRRK